MNDTVNKSSRNKKIAIIAGGVLLVGTLAAYASGKSGWKHGHRMNHAIDRVSEDLNLNADQTIQLEQLGEQLQQARKSLRAAGDIDAILASVQGATLDQGALNSLASAKISTAQQQIPELIAALAVFYDGLNPQQQTEARKKLGKLAKRIKSHKHKHDDD